MKLKIIEPMGWGRGGGGSCVPSTPLNPPLIMHLSICTLVQALQYFIQNDEHNQEACLLGSYSADSTLCSQHYCLMQ